MAQNVIIHGNTYSDVPRVEIPKSGSSGNAVFYDSSDASASASDILTGKTAYIGTGAVNGSMANNGSTSGTISTKAGTVSIPSGYTSGGTVQISSSEQAKIVTGNIKSGVTILGVSGKPTVVDTEISSGGATASTILSGSSAYVNGSLINGSASMPTISQDTTTKVLSIS